MSVLNRFSLEGKTALVTGCKRGIGKAMACALAGAGADIVGVSATLELENSEVSKEVNALDRKFTGYACDFSDRRTLHSFIDDLNENHPNIDILVNNAGTIMRAPASEHSEDYWDTVVEVNLNAQFILSKSVGNKMLERKSGKIIFTASILTFQGGIAVPGYAASKGAIGQLTKALSNEWATHGINVNAIAPGYIRTDNTKALQEDINRSQSILDRIPARRWGETEDFAGPIVFLASSASDYMHGSILTVDGGWMGR